MRVFLSSKLHGQIATAHDGARAYREHLIRRELYRFPTTTPLRGGGGGRPAMHTAHRHVAPDDAPDSPHVAPHHIACDRASHDEAQHGRREDTHAGVDNARTSLHTAFTLAGWAPHRAVEVALSVARHIKAVIGWSGPPDTGSTPPGPRARP